MSESATITNHTTRATTKVRVKLPGPLKSVTPIGSEFPFQGGSLAELFREIDQSHPGFLGRITETGGKIRPYINIFVNGKSSNSLQGMATPLGDGDQITIMLSFAGG